MERFNLDLQFRDEPANAGHFGHSRDGSQLRGDRPVLQAAKLGEVVANAFDRVPENLTRGNSISRKTRL